MYIGQHLKFQHIQALIRTKLWAQILLAMVLGVVVGLVFSPYSNGAFSITLEQANELGEWLRLPGSIFLNLIQMVVVPLIVTSIILGLTSAGDIGFLRAAGIRIVPYFVGTTIVAVLIGVAVVTLIKPGQYIDVATLTMSSVDAAEGFVNASPVATKSIASQIADLIPANLFSATLSRNMLQIVVAAL